MPLTPYRVVLDTNLLLRGMINPRSASGRILQACDKRLMVPVLSKAVLGEYQFILTDPKVVARYPKLETRKVEVTLARLSYLGDLIRTVRERFDYSRDRKDAKLIELAIAGRATHLLTSDRDLLDLPNGHDEASKRFRQRLPKIHLLEPGEFVHRFGRELGIDESGG